MRALFLIFLFACASITYAQNSIRLSSFNGNTFRVLEKGKTLNETWQASVLIENIRKDTLLLELEFENRKKFTATLYLLEQGTPCRNKEFDYRVECDNITLKIVFTGIYDIRRLPEPLVPKKPVVDTTSVIRNKVFAHFCELKEGKPFYFNNLPKEGACATAMPNDYLGYTATLISRAQVQDYKFTIVENVCRNNCLSVEQLNVLLNYIDYEIEKLKFVRLAYPHLVDPVNKKNLEKNFRFEASVRELNIFLAQPDNARQASLNNCTKPASEMIINSYAEKLGNFGNDTERYEAFKKGYADLCYSSDQAALILNKFTHDREKLDAAKLLYYYCVDKENFMKVADLFSYNQTKSELKDFIDKQTQ